MPSLLSRVIRPQRAGLRGLRATAGDGVVVGVNKYSHDTSVCISCCKTGEPLLIWSKERQSRRKHDGGDIAELMQAALQHLNLSQDDVALVVSNNHHFRVLPYEEQHTQLAWSAALGHIPASYSSDFNLLPAARHLEVSHHLAHAWSAAAQAPFDKGLVVVMDGMGESFSAMRSAKEKEEQDYFHDLLLAEDEKFLQTHDVEQQEKGARHGFREAESAYMFQKDRATNTISLNKVMKRWTEEVSPPELYNHGFENMQSVGAVYSRVSSNIFGDWNACGKVMGLAPWHSLWSKDSSKPPLIMRGNVLKNELEINHDELRKQPLAGQKFGLDAGDWSESTKYSSIAEYTSKLAFAVQKDLESVALQMIEELKIHTGARNLCFVGGVGLNSVLNGRISRELGFEKVFIPPYPGDDGIAVGCCAFGLFSGNGRRALAAKAKLAPKLWAGPLSPYQGPQYSLTDIEEAVEASLPWLEVKEAKSVDDFLDRMVSDMADGHVIAWWQGRSEAGPRALGHRSILADPRRANMVSHINSKVKGREAFRPFAPSVLAAEAHEWFEGIPAGEREGDVSPYMSITSFVKDDKRDKIPAVTHVDGTSRLQTVTEDSEPLYFALIRAFFRLTGVPMVLNTSFNTIKSEPITESPSDGIRSFLSARGAIETLFMESKWIISRKPFPSLDRCSDEELSAVYPRMAGGFVSETFERVAEMGEGEVTRVRVSMPSSVTSVGDQWRGLTDSLEAELLASCNGDVSVLEMLHFFESDANNKDKDDYLEEVTRSDIFERLRELYDLCLIHFD